MYMYMYMYMYMHMYIYIYILFVLYTHIVTLSTLSADVCNKIHFL